MAGREVCPKLCTSSLPAKAGQLCSFIEKHANPMVCSHLGGLCDELKSACDVVKDFQNVEVCEHACQSSLTKACDSTLPMAMAKGQIKGCASKDCVTSLCGHLVGQ